MAPEEEMIKAEVFNDIIPEKRESRENVNAQIFTEEEK